MQVMAKSFCRFDLVRYIDEKILNRSDGSIVTISLTEKNNKEQMIFLKRNHKTLEYEIVVYKHRKSDHYIENPYDTKIKRVEESSIATTFYFDNFKSAIYFLQYFGFYHKEYQFRPSAKLATY